MEKPLWLWIIELLISLIAGIGGGFLAYLKINSFVLKQRGKGKNVQQSEIVTQKGNSSQQMVTSEITPTINNYGSMQIISGISNPAQKPNGAKNNPSVEYHKMIEEGTHLLDQGKFRESAYIFEKTCGMEPSEFMPHFYLGFLYLSIGMPDASIIHSEKSIALGKDFFAAWMNLGVAFVHNRQPERAIFAFDRAEQLKDQANAVELGKLYLFRAEARYNFYLQQKHSEQLLQASIDLDKGEETLRKDNENPVAKFWLDQVPNRRNTIRGVMVP